MYSGVRFMKIDVNASTNPLFLCVFNFWGFFWRTCMLASPHFKLNKYYPLPNPNINIKKNSNLLNTVKIDGDF